ncbi:MAG: PAAR-like domain-containing protein [Polyangiaceae bacterium]
MLPSTTNGPGMSIGFPDVCMTPAGPAVVPIPYPNIAPHATAAPFALTVFLTKRPGLNMGSKVPMTTGDEGGVAHPMIKGPGSFTMGNPKVFVEKLPGIHLTCPTMGNGVNNGLGMVAVPSGTTVFYTLAHGEPSPSAPDPYARELDMAAAEALAETLARGLVSATVDAHGTGHLVIGAFSPDLPSAVWTALRDMESRGMRRLVVDLCGCPGGDGEAALSMAGDFVSEGTVLGIVKDSDGDEREVRSVTETPFDWPMAILVDERTASAAEVFAGSLAFHRRAILVGTRTYGKGAAQRLITAEDGALYSASVAEVRTPEGGLIEGVGLTPHIRAEGREEALESAVRALRDAG